MLEADFLNGSDRPPHENIGRIGAYILGMTTYAAFRDIDLPAAFDLREQRGFVSRFKDAIDAE
jgi:hypothetical protein